MKASIAFRNLLLASILLAWTSIGYPTALRGATVTTFDPVGSVQTNPTSINSTGVVTGYYQASNITHGFIRLAAGTVIPFDIPGAVATRPNAINDSGQVTGTYTTNTEFNSFHGFLRDADGSIVTFDLMPLPTGNGTFPMSINASGQITGWLNNNGHPHGFIRASDGTVITFDPPNGANTQPVSINAIGEVTGSFFSGSGVLGFVRAADGSFQTFGVHSPWANAPVAINDSGAVVTNLTASFCLNLIPICIPGQARAYRRNASGLIVPIEVQLGTGTVVTSINGPGQVIGASYPLGFPTAFIRQAFGTYETFTLSSISTVPTAINNSGTITGIYVGTDGNLHGFIRTP